MGYLTATSVESREEAVSGLSALHLRDGDTGQDLLGDREKLVSLLGG
jgi:hypothetical protein